MSRQSDWSIGVQVCAVVFAVLIFIAAQAIESGADHPASAAPEVPR